MSLALVLRVSAGWMGLWVIMMFFAPEMVVEGAGWEVGVEVRTILQGMGMAYIGLIVTQLVTQGRRLRARTLNQQGAGYA